MKFFKAFLVCVLFIGPMALAKKSAFDVSEVCSSADSMGQLSEQLNFSQREEAETKKNWEPLVKEYAASLQDGCRVPYRWKKLVDALIGTKRFDDAVMILIKMKKNKASFAPYFISKLDKEFLNSDQFKTSEPGKSFEAEQKLIETMVAQAKEKIKSMDKSLRPPALYVSNKACPFEYCQLGKWKSRVPIKVFEEIRSTKVIKEIPKGVVVTALEGKVLKEPEPGVMIKVNTESNAKELKVGEVVYILDYTGEGSMNVWYNGKVRENLLEYNDIYEESAVNVPEGGLLKRIYPEKKFAEEWWVQIKDPSGAIGWVEVDTKKLSQFDGMCFKSLSC